MMHYTGTIWRPPYEADSLLLEVTAGCTHHQCKFCTLYSDLPFKFRLTPMEDMENDLLEVQTLRTNPYSRTLTRLQGKEAPEPIRRVFLTGANPFVLKTEKLLDIAALIHSYLPSVESIGCFARITDSVNKTDDDLLRLRQAGYNGLTIGVETGDDAALAFMRKGYASRDILEQCRRLEQAGIEYGFFYLTGISGKGRGEAGVKASAEIFNQLHPFLVGPNMLTIYPESGLYQEIHGFFYLTGISGKGRGEAGVKASAEIFNQLHPFLVGPNMLTIYPESGLYQEIQSGNWEEEGELEKYRELRVLVEHLSISTYFAAMGASNAFQLRGRLPEDRKKLLDTLDQIIAEVSEDDLRHYRKNLRHL